MDDDFFDSADTRFDRLPELPPGSRIAQYTVIKTLGSGGVGRVYLAKHNLLQHHVAIKVHEEIPSEEDIRTAFRRSSSYLCQLKHPNIVTFINYGFEGERAYMAMEFIDGPSLQSIIDTFQSKEGVEQAIRYFEQLLEAVHYAHNCSFKDLDGEEQRGIIHGDIKPENILVSRGSIKLTDFMVPNVQRFLARRQHFRFSGFPIGLTDVFGTPYYMAPEQLVHGEVSQRTDVFSLGVTLFHLLTGRYPYKGPEYLMSKTTPAQYTSGRGKELPASHLNPHVPESIDAFIEKATQLDEAQRYRSVAEMIRDFVRRLNRYSSGSRTSEDASPLLKHVFGDNPFRFQVALSFPGEYRQRVERIAFILADALGRERVLYDKWNRAEFARPNLDVYLPNLYHKQSLLLVFFLCSEFAQKEWCGLEWRAGRDLLKKGDDERLMLLRLDRSEIPGLYDTDGYLDIDRMPEDEVAEEILSRLILGTSRTIKESGLGFIFRQTDETSDTRAPFGSDHQPLRTFPGRSRQNLIMRVLGKLRSLNRNTQ